MFKHLLFPLLLLIPFFLFGQANQSELDSLLLTTIKSNNTTQVKSLVLEGANVNVQDGNGATALMWAAYQSNRSMVQFLVEAGGNCRQKGVIHENDGSYFGNLVGIAASQGKLDLLKYLLEVCEIDIDDKELNPATGEEDGWTALQWALARNQGKCIEYLIKKGANTSISVKELTSYFQNLGDYSEALHYAYQELENVETTYGKENIEYGKILYQIGKLHKFMGEIEKASNLYREAIKNFEKTLRKEQPNYGIMLSVLGDLHVSLGEYKQAIAILTQSLEFQKTTSGKEHPNYGNTLYVLGKLLIDLGEYKQALPFYIECLQINEKILGKWHPHNGYILQELANIYIAIGEYDEALLPLKNALDNQTRNLGKNHRDNGIILNNLGALYCSMGQYEKALSSYLEAQEIDKKTLGEEHPDYASTLNNLGNLYIEIGEYEKALQLLLNALEIYLKNFGENHPNYGTLLNNLGGLYLTMNKYEEALPYFLKSLAFFEAKMGVDPVYPIALDNLSATYRAMGEYEKALPLLLESLDNFEKNLGKEHPEYGTVVNNLGFFYLLVGENEKALPLLLESLDIREKTLGKEHPDYGATLDNIGLWHQITGKYGQALSLRLDALINHEKSYGKGHPTYGVNLANIGLLYQELNEFEQALSFHLKALKSIEESLGNEHPKYGEILINLGFFYWQRGDLKLAGNYFMKANKNLTHQLKNRFESLGDPSQQAFLSSFSRQLDKIHSFILYQQNNQQLVSSGFNDQLLIKGLLKGKQYRLLNSLRNDPNEKIRTQFKQWSDLYRLLGRQYMMPKNKRLQSFSKLQRKSQELDLTLSQSSQKFRSIRKIVKWQELQQNLGQDEAVIEFSHFQIYNCKGKRVDSIMYVAYVLNPGDEMATMVPLFEERELKNWLSGSSNLDEFYISFLYDQSPEETNPIYALTWEPLDSLLHGIKKVYYSPSGLLHRINLAALPTADGRRLGEKYKLISLGSSRSLAFSTAPKVFANQDASLWGGIQYDMDSLAIATNASPTEEIGPSVVALTRRIDYGTRGGQNRWNYLPGSEREIDQITSTLEGAGFTVQAHKGYSATEDNFYRLGSDGASPRILHIATHGYFFPDPEESSDQALLERRYDDLPPVQLSEHPMVRSGILLAGANHTWTGKPKIKGLEDGILTAYEISQLDLSNTELVVLSACETGLGDIDGNEGVYGLQRAFKIAGARYVIMSLWQIPDQHTSEMLTIFYQKWIEEQVPIRKAFEQAQTAMRRKYQEAYYWAGFVLVE